MKQCTNKECLKWYPTTTEYFYKQKETKDGLSSWCIPCKKKYQNKYKEKNMEKAKKDWQTFYSKNKDRLNEKCRIWNQENKDQAKRNLRNFQQNNPDKIKSYGEDRQNKNHRISNHEWEECKKYFNHRCAYCDLKIEEHWIERKGKIKLYDFHKEHVDHNGANDLSNCVPSCKSCNSKKWIYPLEIWYCEENEYYSHDRLNNIKKWLNDDYKKYFTERES